MLLSQSQPETVRTLELWLRVQSSSVNMASPTSKSYNILRDTLASCLLYKVAKVEAGSSII